MILLIAVLVLYAAACGTFGSTPHAPLWLRWPLPIWNFIAHDWRRPAPVPARPDYARIAVLERELGLVDSHMPELSPFEQGMRSAMAERPIRLDPTVCLTKDCAGDTDELRTWSGQLLRRTHTCD
ncbi:hypothetical protein [Streptomyces sp. NPDC020747]|uniref:hypothetical protein n=1 Tax=Streptomyces sp. NPDC020747 TaxID=3365086 RepID=UPI0037877423